MGIALGLIFTVLSGMLADLAFPSAAYAYLDGGSGSLIIQALIAGLIFGGVGVSAFFRRIFRSRAKANPDKTDE